MILEPEEAEIINMVAEVTIATMIEFIEALTDTSSDEYRVAADNIKAIFQEEFENVARLHGLTLDSLWVVFSEGSGGQRKRRSTTGTADAAITVVFDAPVLQSTDRTELGNEITSSVQTAANAAISNSDGTFISPDAVALCHDLTDATYFNDQDDKSINTYERFHHSLANGYMVELTGWTHIRTEYAKGYIRTTMGTGYATISGLKENTDYTIDVYNYASEIPGTNRLDIGNDIDSVQSFDTEQGLSEDPSVSGIIVKSAPDGRIFLRFRRTEESEQIHFSGLSVSRTQAFSCDEPAEPGKCNSIVFVIICLQDFA